MKKNVSVLLAGFAFMAALMMSCTTPQPEKEEDPNPDPIDNPDNPTPDNPTPDPDPTPDPPDPSKLGRLLCTVPVTDNWIFDDKPRIVIQMKDTNSVAMTAAIKVRFSTDMKEEVEVVEQSVEVPAKGEAEVEITTSQSLAPGFYKATCFVNGVNQRIAVFGISPFQIVSAPDKQPDFDEFWDTAKAQLAAVDMNPVLTEIPAKSSADCKVYFVEMQSVPDGLTGEPVTIRGYYLEPTDGQKHPVLMQFEGYDSQNGGKLSCPGGGTKPQYSMFYLSHRGQYINNRPASKREDGIDQDFVNIYGDWFAYHFGDKDSYYYRGAFMDCVQAVRFMATRETSDMNNLFAWGSSQGGALTYAAAALSDYPFTAIAPCVAFLGDFPDYFKIVSWPGDTAFKSKPAGMSDEEMYAFLSYFDTKNLATRISCPVLACSGLKDETCPPHTNIAPFNNLLSTDKQYYFYPEMTHQIPSNWPALYKAFFKDRMH